MAGAPGELLIAKRLVGCQNDFRFTLPAGFEQILIPDFGDEQESPVSGISPL